MLKRMTAVLLIVAMLCVIGCATHHHQVGNGAQGQKITEARQWYILWGLVPLNEVDTNEMAGQTANYDITTEITTLDWAMNIFTSVITVHSRTVTVKK